MHATGKAGSTAVIVSLCMVVSAFAVVTMVVAPAGTTAKNVMDVTAPASNGAALSSGVAVALHGANPPCTATVNTENGADDAIQTVLNAIGPNSVVCIGKGVWPEQLTISTPGITLRGVGNGSASTNTIIEPSTLVQNTYDYDAPGGPTSTPAAAVILVEGSSQTPTTGVSGVTIQNLQVNGEAGATASFFSSCGVDFFGVDFQASGGTLANVAVTNIQMATGYFGCQGSLAVYAYNGYFNFEGTNNQPDKVVVSNSTISAYQKNGFTCDDLGETCGVSNTTVTGIGGTTLTAQNGIQIGYGANGKLKDNTVAGDHYTGGIGTNGDYFAPIYLACGVLIYDGGNLIHVYGNRLSGNDLTIAVFGTANATVSYNTVTQSYAYGITFDLNAALDYLGLPVYSTDTPWHSAAVGDTIQNTNVGILAYDDNVTIAHLSTDHVNVSVEAVADFAGATYAVSITHSTLLADVSGALLGNISSYQSEYSLVQQSVGVYTLTDDTITAGAGAPPTGGAFGVLLDPTSGTVTHCTVGGFSVGIQAGNVYPTNPVEPTGTFVIENNIVTAPSGGGTAGDTGILVAGGSVTVTDNAVSGYLLMTNPSGYSSWFEDVQSVGIFVGCAAGSSTCTISFNTLDLDTIGIVYSLLTYTFQGITPSPATIDGNMVTDSSAYGLLAEPSGATGISTIEGNVVDNLLSGAPGAFLLGAAFEVTGNTFIGTSTTGSNGASQGQDGCGLGPINTASVEATDCFNSGLTAVTMNANLFLQTTTYWDATFEGASTFSGGELVTFDESGLATSTLWSVTLDGLTGTTPAPNPIVEDLQNSSSPYAFTVGLLAGYLASPTSGTVSVLGAPPLPQLITFTVAPLLKFAESNLPAGTLWYLNITGEPSMSGTATQLSVSLPNGHYTYTVGTVNKHWAAPGGAFTVSGVPLSIPVLFTKQGFAVTFTATFPSALKQLRTLELKGWTVVLNGTVEHNTGTTIRFTDIPNGTLPVLVTGPSGFVATGSGTVTVKGATGVAVTITKGKTVTLTFHQKGLSGVTWCVSLDGYQLCSSSGKQKFANLGSGTTYSYMVGPVAGHSVSMKIGTLSEPTSGPITMTKTTTVQLTYTVSV